MALLIPTPESVYRGNYASLPAKTLAPPIESNRTVPVEINWLNNGQSPRYTIHFNARQQQTLPISQISALHIDNSQCGSSMHVAFADTQFEVIAGPNTVGFYPVVTNSLEFWAWLDLTPLSQDKTIIQVLNFLPPPIFVSTQPGGTGVGTVRNVGTAAPITGGPITDTGTIGLSTPLAINFGGTGAATAPLALDNLASTGGAAAGALTRSSGGVWSLTAAGAGTISAVNAGTGLTGGGTTGAVTVSLAVPVTVANGGTGGTTPGAALAALGAAPLANPVFTGDPQAPTPAPGDNDTSIATTAFVQTVTSNYLPLSGGRLSGGLASGPAATPVPLAGALTLNANTVAPPAGLTQNFYVVGADAAVTAASLDNFGNTNAINFRLAAGTAAAPTAIQSGNVIGTIRGQGRGASAYGANNACSLDFYAAENWTGTAQGSGVRLVSTPIGSTAAVVSLSLQGNTATFSGMVNTGSRIIASAVQPSISVYSTAAPAVAGGMWIGNGTDGTLYFGAVDGSGNPATPMMQAIPGGNFTIQGATATKASGTTWANPSARDLKENIQNYSQGLQAILALQPRTYSFAADSGIDAPGEHIGLIHDETGHMPEMHRTLSVGSGDEAREVDGLDCSAITFALVNAIKELKAEIDALKGGSG